MAALTKGFPHGARAVRGAGLLPVDRGTALYRDHLQRGVELGNVACDSQQELRPELRWAVARLRHKPDMIRAAIRQCGY